MKRVLITGGNGDLAIKLSEYLKRFFIVDLPSRIELDVTSISNVDLFFKNKYYDVVVNLAGTLYSSTIVESDPNLWINDINVNLVGTYLVSRKSLLKNSDCLIVNISSTAAYNSYNDWSSYCSSKVGVLKISGALFKDGYNILTLCPGAINTKIRNKLDINNNNVMTIEEGVAPIIDAINGKYNNGDIVFYRKNNLSILAGD